VTFRSYCVWPPGRLREKLPYGDALDVAVENRIGAEARGEDVGLGLGDLERLRVKVEVVMDQPFDGLVEGESIGRPVVIPPLGSRERAVSRGAARGQAPGRANRRASQTAWRRAIQKRFRQGQRKRLRDEPRAGTAESTFQDRLARTRTATQWVGASARGRSETRYPEPSARTSRHAPRPGPEHSPGPTSRPTARMSTVPRTGRRSIGITASPPVD